MKLSDSAMFHVKHSGAVKKRNKLDGEWSIAQRCLSKGNQNKLPLLEKMTSRTSKWEGAECSSAKISGSTDRSQHVASRQGHQNPRVAMVLSWSTPVVVQIKPTLTFRSSNAAKTCKSDVLCTLKTLPED